jgi:hypothetical protein
MVWRNKACVYAVLCVNAALAAEFSSVAVSLMRVIIYQRVFIGYAEDASAFQGRQNEKNDAIGED